MHYVADALPVHETERYRTRELSQIETFVIHHSATGPNTLPKTIAEYHVKQWDWPGIGYHYVIAADGLIYQTNDLETVSNQAANMNTRSVGICFLGYFMGKVPPPEQIDAGAHLLAWLLGELGLDLETVKGHREYMQTACPGDQWLNGQNWKETLWDRIREVQAEREDPGTAPPEPVAPAVAPR
jgi:N-acetyl-anhydromuramyl-L-alanine amidase AmpD